MPLAPIEQGEVPRRRGRDFILPGSLPWVKRVYMLLNFCLFFVVGAYVFVLFCFSPVNLPF